jgi:hypothetical protein
MAQRRGVPLPPIDVYRVGDLDRPRGASTPLVLRGSAVRRFRPTN